MPDDASIDHAEAVHSPTSVHNGLRHHAFAIYQHISAVIGALALAVFLGHFLELDWRGALAQLLDVWRAFVRPAVALLLDIIIVYPCRWCFNWHIEIPLLTRDYFAAGIVLSLSGVRAESSLIWPLLLSAGEEYFSEMHLAAKEVWYGLAIKPFFSLIIWMLRLPERHRRRAARRRLRRALRMHLSALVRLQLRWHRFRARFRLALFIIRDSILMIFWKIIFYASSFLLFPLLVILQLLFFLAMTIMWPLMLIANILVFTRIGDYVMAGLAWPSKFMRASKIEYNLAEIFNTLEQNRQSRRHLARLTLAPLFYMTLLILLNYLF